LPMALCGLIKSAIFAASGISSRRISILFPSIPPGTEVARPVMLPPGCERLCTRPIPTGSYTVISTIGMVAVAPSIHAGHRVAVGQRIGGQAVVFLLYSFTNHLLGSE